MLPLEVWQQREMNVKRIVIGADHAAFERKEQVVKFLRAKQVEVEDVGCFSEERVPFFLPSLLFSFSAAV